MGKVARIVFFTTTAVAFSIAASGSIAIADTGGPGVTAHVIARP
jgi:hypothetical protein